MLANLYSKLGVIRSVEFGLSFACAFGALGLGPDPVLLGIALAIGWVFAAIGLGTASTLKPITKAFWIMVVFVFFCIEGGLLYWHSLPSSRSLDQTVLLECYRSPLPTKVPSYGFYQWQLLGHNDGGFITQGAEPGSPIVWPDNFHQGQSWICKFTNYGLDGLIDLKAQFELKYSEPISPDGQAFTAGKIVKTIILPNPPARLGTGNNNIFAFYIVNRSAYWITFKLPTIAQAKKVGSTNYQNFQLIPASFGHGGLLGVNMEPLVFPKGPQAAPPPIPVRPIPRGTK